MKIVAQCKTGKYTLLTLSQEFPNNWSGEKVRINDKNYSSLPVYDLPMHIAILGSGEFKGKNIEFI